MTNLIFQQGINKLVYDEGLFLLWFIIKTLTIIIYFSKSRKIRLHLHISTFRSNVLVIVCVNFL